MEKQKNRAVFKPEGVDKVGEMLLYGKARYKVAHGGRDGGKSYTFADCIIAKAIEKKRVIAVCREIEITIRDSVHRLLRERISYHNLDALFHITYNSITYNPNGSMIVYKHLHDNVKEIKGLEGSDICWIFEAESLEKESFDILDPTIRKEEFYLDEDGNKVITSEPEIWIEFNPDNEDDFVYDKFITNTPDNAIVVQILYNENPYCPENQKKLAAQCQKDNIEDYNHIWLGQPRKTGGKFYPGFSREVHTKPHECNENLFNFNFLAKYAQLFMAIDPHTVYYPFCLWIARIKLGKEFYYVVYNEFPTLGFFNGEYYYKKRKEVPCTLSMNDLATMFRVIDCTVGNTQLDVTITERYVDTRFAKASGAKSWSTNTEGLITEFSKPENGGVILKQPKEKIIDMQRDPIRDAIKVNADIPICLINQPRWLVMPHCYNTIDTLLNHRYDMDNATEDEKRKDPSDALRICFAGMSGYSWEDPNKPAEEDEFLLEQETYDINHSLA